MKVKVATKHHSGSNELATPPDIEEQFDSTSMSRRRSMQVSVPDQHMAEAIHLQNVIIDANFSRATRAIWKPHLDVTTHILGDRDLLNQFGNICVDRSQMEKLIRADRVSFLRDYIIRCKVMGIDYSWINTSDL